MSLSSLLRKPGLGMATGKSQNPRPGDSMDAGDSRHQHPQLMLSVAYQACLSSPGNPPFGIIRPKCLASVRPGTRGPGKCCEQYSPMSMKAR